MQTINIPSLQAQHSSLAVERLTALWALSEAGLGGLLHVMKVPFTGIMVGGSAVVFITLIAFFAKEKSVLLRSLLIVLIAKVLVSPHSPLPAYMAVSFQGLLGMLLFHYIKNIRLAAVLLALLALLQSSLQKLIVLTLIFGNPLWKAVNSFGTYVLQQLGASTVSLELSQWLIAGYVLVHLVAGLLIGWLAGKLPGWLVQYAESHQSETLALQAHLCTLPNADASMPAPKRRKVWWQRRSFIGIVLLSVIMAALTLLLPRQNRFAEAAAVLTRSLLVLTVWYALIAPLLMDWLQRLLHKQQGRHAAEVQRVLAILPYIRVLVAPAWHEAGRVKGLHRYRLFMVSLISAVLTFQGDFYAKPGADTPR